MNNIEKNHQAKQLEKIFKEVCEHEAKMHHPNAAQMKQPNNIDHPKVDVLNLPPRREVHEAYEKGIKLTMSLPLFRLIIVLIILFITAGLVFYDIFLTK